MTDGSGESGEKVARQRSGKRRRVVFVEYDITDMTDEQVHALLLALACNRETSFHVEVEPSQA